VSERSAVVIVVVVIVGVRPRHVVGSQASAVATVVVGSGGIVRVVPGAVVVGRSSQSLTLNLVSSLGKHREITTTVIVMRSVWGSKRCI
jgi:hypothetical protein